MSSLRLVFMAGRRHGPEAGFSDSSLASGLVRFNHSKEKLVPNGYVEMCRGEDSAEGCNNEARYLIAWSPAVIEDEGMHIDVPSTEIGAALVEDIDLDRDFVLVCPDHRVVWENHFKEVELPGVGNNVDYLYVALLASTTVIERERYVPEKVETHEVLKPDVDVEEISTEEPQRDPEAPWGRKADGTPKRRPGRKTVAPVESNA